MGHKPLHRCHCFIVVVFWKDVPLNAPPPRNFCFSLYQHSSLFPLNSTWAGIIGTYQLLLSHENTTPFLKPTIKCEDQGCVNMAFSFCYHMLPFGKLFTSITVSVAYSLGSLMPFMYNYVNAIYVNAIGARITIKTA